MASSGMVLPHPGHFLALSAAPGRESGNEKYAMISTILAIKRISKPMRMIDVIAPIK